MPVPEIVCTSHYHKVISDRLFLYRYFYCVGFQTSWESLICFPDCEHHLSRIPNLPECIIVPSTERGVRVLFSLYGFSSYAAQISYN